MRQTVGRTNTINGTGTTDLEECVGETPFSVLVSANEGRFAGGKASIFARAIGCIDNFTFCDEDEESRIVQLRGK